MCFQLLAGCEGGAARGMEPVEESVAKEQAEDAEEENEEESDDESFEDEDRVQSLPAGTFRFRYVASARGRFPFLRLIPCG